MTLGRYPEYRASGVEWLGEVPAHWAIAALGYRYEVALGKMLDAKQVSGRHLAPYVRNADVQWGRINTSDLNEMDFDPAERVRFALRRGDLLVCEGGEVGRCAVWDEPIHPCFYQKAIHRLRPFTSADTPRFFQWVLNAAVHGGCFAAEEAKATIAHLPAEALRRQRFAFPTVGEQHAIATFLDRETAKIDALVAEQERLIELLKEKRQTVISHAVTKGLDPDAPMKESGVEWLGKIPAHWTLNRLKQISPFITVGIVVNPSNYVSDQGYPFIYGGDIREGKIDDGNARRISAADSYANAKTRLEAGDLLTVRVGAPGVTAVVPPSCDGGNCASVMLIRRGGFNSDWLCLVMNARVVRYQVEVVQYGAAQEQFNISHAVDFFVPTPPREEQDVIASSLGQQVGRLDLLVAEAERAITLLTERRTALISAAVTGQIDVRGLAAPPDVHDAHRCAPPAGPATLEGPAA